MEEFQSGRDIRTIFQATNGAPNGQAAQRRRAQRDEAYRAGRDGDARRAGSNDACGSQEVASTSETHGSVGASSWSSISIEEFGRAARLILTIFIGDRMKGRMLTTSSLFGPGMPFSSMFGHRSSMDFKPRSGSSSILPQEFLLQHLRLQTCAPKTGCICCKSALGVTSVVSPSSPAGGEPAPTTRRRPGERPREEGAAPAPWREEDALPREVERPYYGGLV